jgi:hypothetical protein
VTSIDTGSTASSGAAAHRRVERAEEAACPRTSRRATRSSGEATGPR